jgi:SulP family sulfate permease
VPFLDSTAANAISRTAEKARHRGVRVIITGTSEGVREALQTHGVQPPRVSYSADIAGAVAEIKTHLSDTRSALS